MAAPVPVVKVDQANKKIAFPSQSGMVFVGLASAGRGPGLAVVKEGPLGRSLQAGRSAAGALLPCAAAMATSHGMLPQRMASHRIHSKGGGAHVVINAHSILPWPCPCKQLPCKRDPWCEPWRPGSLSYHRPKLVPREPSPPPPPPPPRRVWNPPKEPQKEKRRPLPPPRPPPPPPEKMTLIRVRPPLLPDVELWQPVRLPPPALTLIDVDRWEPVRVEPPPLDEAHRPIRVAVPPLPLLAVDVDVASSAWAAVCLAPPLLTVLAEVAPPWAPVRVHPPFLEDLGPPPPPSPPPSDSGEPEHWMVIPWIIPLVQRHRLIHHHYVPPRPPMLLTDKPPPELVKKSSPPEEPPPPPTAGPPLPPTPEPMCVCDCYCAKPQRVIHSWKYIAASKAGGIR